jgi:hypothetical protein
MRPWSKLQKEIEKLFADELLLRIQCRAYRMNSQCGSTDIPRYWITLGKDIIFDYPKDFPKAGASYPYLTDVSSISRLIRDYIDTPVGNLLNKEFDDPWGIVEIFLAADRRIGQRRFQALRKKLRSDVAKLVLEKRDAS